LKIALKPTGVITFEFPRLLRLIEENQFDTVYHKHFSYLSFLAVGKIFAHHGLTLFAGEEVPTHGGSLHIFGRQAENGTAAAVMTDRGEDEGEGGEFRPQEDGDLHHVQRKGEGYQAQAFKFLIEAKDAGKEVAAYGAAAKGVTLMNYCGVRNDLVDYVVDKSP
jgi:hypothetical protein